MSMMSYLFLIIILVYLWTETSAPIEYFRLFRLKFTKFQEYDKFKEQTPSMEYFNFLLMKYPNFLVKLITCPICVITWANIGLILFNWEKGYLWGFNVFVCLVGYFGLKLIIKKSDG